MGILTPTWQEQKKQMDIGNQQRLIPFPASSVVALAGNVCLAMGKALKDLFTCPVTLELTPNYLATPTILTQFKRLTNMQIDHHHFHYHHHHRIAFSSLELHKVL